MPLTTTEKSGHEEFVSSPELHFDSQPNQHSPINGPGSPIQNTQSVNYVHSPELSITPTQLVLSPKTQNIQDTTTMNPEKHDVNQTNNNTTKQSLAPQQRLPISPVNANINRNIHANTEQSDNSNQKENRARPRGNLFSPKPSRLFTTSRWRFSSATASTSRKKRDTSDNDAPSMPPTVAKKPKSVVQTSTNTTSTTDHQKPANQNAVADNRANINPQTRTHRNMLATLRAQNFYMNTHDPDKILVFEQEPINGIKQFQAIRRNGYDSSLRVTTHPQGTYVNYSKQIDVVVMRDEYLHLFKFRTITTLEDLTKSRFDLNKENNYSWLVHGIKSKNFCSELQHNHIEYYIMLDTSSAKVTASQIKQHLGIIFFNQLAEKLNLKARPLTLKQMINDGDPRFGQAHIELFGNCPSFIMLNPSEKFSVYECAVAYCQQNATNHNTSSQSSMLNFMEHKPKKTTLETKKVQQTIIAILQQAKAISQQYRQENLDDRLTHDKFNILELNTAIQRLIQRIQQLGHLRLQLTNQLNEIDKAGQNKHQQVYQLNNKAISTVTQIIRKLNSAHKECLELKRWYAKNATAICNMFKIPYPPGGELKQLLQALFNAHNAIYNPSDANQMKQWYQQQNSLRLCRILHTVINCPTDIQQKIAFVHLCRAYQLDTEQVDHAKAIAV